jgi:hypothetical protein
MWPRIVWYLANFVERMLLLRSRIKWPKLMLCVTAGDVRVTGTKVFLDPGVSGPARVSNVDLTTLARDAAHAHCLQVMPTLQRSKETGSLALRKANIDVISEAAVTVRTFC